MSLLSYIKKRKKLRNENVNFINDFMKDAMFFLSNGTYFFDFKRKIIYNCKYKKEYRKLKKNTFLNLVAKNKNKKNFFKKIIYAIISKKSSFCVKTNDKRFNGTIALIGSTNNDFKVFDFQKNIVLSVFESEERAKKILKSRKAFHSFGFNTLGYYSEKQKKSTLVFEPMVHSKFYKHDLIFPDIINIYTFVHKRHKSRSWSYVKETINAIEEFMPEIVSPKRKNDSIFFDELLTHRNCLQLCHGDFHHFNYLFDGQNFFFIDFEFVNYQIFFYDIFFYVYFEAYRFNDLNIWQDMLEGRFDEPLSDLFCVNGCSYKRSDLPLYLLCTIFVFYDNSIPKDVGLFLKDFLNEYEQKK